MTHAFAQVISGDSHVNEPTELWWNAMGEKFGDRTPRLLDEYQGENGRFIFTGLRVMKLSDDEDELRNMGVALNVGYEPQARLDFQREAGVAAEIINPTFGLHQLVGPDREAMRVAMQIYNDWAAEFISHDRQRLIGACMVPVDDVDFAVAELTRARDQGHWGALINMQPPEGRPPYRDPIYDPLWACAQDLGMPLTLHLATGRNKTALQARGKEEMEQVAGLHLHARLEIMAILGNDFIFGRILDRYPGLDIICSEFEISWLPWFCAKMDELQFAMSHRLELPQLKMKASEYVTKRIWHGMISDPYGVNTMKMLGAETILWGSDFPHVRSVGLNAHDYLAELLSGLPEADQDKVVGGNCARLVVGL